MTVITRVHVRDYRHVRHVEENSRMTGKANSTCLMINWSER